MKVFEKFEVVFENDSDFFASLNWIPFVAGVFVVMVVISLFPMLGVPGI